MNIFIASKGVSAQDAVIALSQKNVSAKIDSLIELSVVISTTFEIGFAQLVVEYSSAVLEFVNAEADSQTTAFSLLLNTELPFPPTAAGTDENVLIQVSGGGIHSFQGEAQKVLRLRFNVKGQRGARSPLVFDKVENRTFLTKTNLEEIKGDAIEFVDSDLLVVSVSKKIATPTYFKLHQNYPNPFNPITKISYSLDRATMVRLVVFNTTGKLVKTILKSRFNAGSYGINVDMTEFPSGIYFYVLEAGSAKSVKKMILVR